MHFWQFVKPPIFFGIVLNLSNFHESALPFHGDICPGFHKPNPIPQSCCNKFVSLIQQKRIITHSVEEICCHYLTNSRFFFFSPCSLSIVFYSLRSVSLMLPSHHASHDIPITGSHFMFSVDFFKKCH